MKRNRILEIIMGILLLAGMFIISKESAKMVMNMNVGTPKEKKQYVVVVDAGHGGADPGKVGVNGKLEMDINLEIARILKEFLEENDVKVIMTRTSANGLYAETDSNKKVADMKKRLEIIEAANPDLVISIHQNSYSEEYIKGAQVFYYDQSIEGKDIAEIIQKQLIKRLDPENKRMVKGNNSYYLLKKTSAPIVIVECGFLSNYDEAEKLSSRIYQEKVAWAVHMGVMQYLNAKNR